MERRHPTPLRRRRLPILPQRPATATEGNHHGLNTGGGAGRHAGSDAYSLLHLGAASTWRGWAPQASLSAGLPATLPATLDGQVFLAQQPPARHDGAGRRPPAARPPPTRLVGLPQAVSGVWQRIALLASILMVGNELRGGVHIIGTIGSGLLGRKRRRGDTSPRCSMDDA